MKKGIRRGLRLGMSAVFGMSVLLSSVTAAPASAASDCIIDTSVTYQTIDGFGGINLPEWVGSDMTDAQVQKAFGNGEDELGFTILRIYVSDDSNAWEKAVPTAKRAQALGAKVFATPWNPPASMRINGDGTLTGGKYQLDKNKWADYAAHLNSFVKYVEGQGIDLYSISVQNEPDYAEDWTYWSASDLASFIAQYGKTVTAGTNARLMSPESFQYRKDIYNEIFNNSAALANTDVFGTHFYGTQRSQMDFPTIENSGKPLWMTEVYVPNSSSDADTYPEALAVAENIHNGLVVGNLNAYVWWYIRRSYGPMKENGNISKRGYCMAQYSKWVRPGDVRIAATESPDSNLLISAYQNDAGQVTIVAVNMGSSDVVQNFVLSNGEKISSVNRYRTSANENLAQTADMDHSDSNFYASLPANSVSTFVVSVGEADPDPDGYYYHDTYESNLGIWSGRGAASVALSQDTAYAGSQSMLVSGRTASWNGATRTLITSVFKPGESYSFSADVCYTAGSSATETFYLTLQYTGSDGEPHYANIASVTAVKGEWVQLANTDYTIPAGASNLQIYVETDGSTIDFYVDEAIGAPGGTVIAGPSPVQFTRGDVNGDGKINATDLALAKRILLGALKDSSAFLAADVDQNGDVTLADIIWYVKFLSGQTDSFPEEGQEAARTMRSLAEYTPVVAASVVNSEPDDSHAEKSGVQYGTVQSGTYYSATCRRNKPYNVLLPAGYTESKQYPVLYVMHGYWENQNRMILEGNGTMATRQIIGNAIAAGEAEEMIVVFPYIYSSASQESCTAMDDENNAAYDNFINDLTNDLMPHIAATYSIKTGRENTAITGFSMGGRESLLIGMQRGDLFGYVGAICAAPGVTGDFQWKNPEEEPSLLFLTAGSNDTVVYSTPENYHNSFAANGVPHVWHYVEGGYHGDNSIHAHLYNFVRAIFRA